MFWLLYVDEDHSHWYNYCKLVQVPSNQAMKKLIFTLSTCLLMSTYLMAQVGDVNKNVEKDKQSKSTKSSSDSGSSDSGSGFFYFLGDALFHSVGAAQMAALENRRIYPKRLSLEAYGTYGTELNSSANLYKTGIRGTWGIFGSDFRYNHLKDFTGTLKEIEWQVLLIRIPIKNVTVDYGMGYIQLPADYISYFNNSLGLEVWLDQPGITITTGYRWTEKSNLGSRYKKNFETGISFNAVNAGAFHLSPTIMYNYLNYFDETSFSLFSVGVVIGLY